jgi:hypothetical protein
VQGSDPNAKVVSGLTADLMLARYLLPRGRAYRGDTMAFTMWTFLSA